MKTDTTQNTIRTQPDSQPQTNDPQHEGLRTPTGFPIGVAVARLKQGRRVARLGWNGKDMYLYMQPGSSFPASTARNSHMQADESGMIRYRDHVDMKTAQGDHVPWLCSQSDLLAEDWIEVPSPTPENENQNQNQNKSE